MKKNVQISLLIIMLLTIAACGQVGPLTLSPDYIAKHATKTVPQAPSRHISSNTNIVQSGI